MSKRDIGMILVAVLLTGSLALWGAITAIDHYALGEDAREVLLHQH